MEFESAADLRGYGGWWCSATGKMASWYNQVQSGTVRYNQIQSGTIRYHQVPVYQVYQEDQDQISGATYISDVVFIN